MQEPQDNVKRVEVGQEITPDLLEKTREILASSLEAHGFTIEVGSSVTGAPDLVVRDEGGNITSILEFKAPRDERIEKARDTLEEIRERNQNAEERLDRLRKRLVTA